MARLTLFGVAGQRPDSIMLDRIRRFAGIAVESAVPLFASRVVHTSSHAIAITGNPFWRRQPLQSDTASAFIDLFRSRGAKALEELEGGFALAILDQAAGRALLAVDRMGIERVAYAVTRDSVVFSCSPAVVARCLGTDSGLRAQALYDYLVLHMVPAPDTVFAGVAKLRAGSYIELSDGKLTGGRYWRPQFALRTARGVEDLAEDLRQRLRAAVVDCQPDAGTGAFLSGGLDSSTVGGLLGEVTGHAPKTFSIGFAVPEFNESAYADLANRRFGARAHRYDVTPDDIVESFPRIAAAFDEPFGNSSAVPTFYCAKLARDHGVTHLLAGDGGDELFAGNERYVRQRMFEVYRRVPAWIRRGLIEPVAAAIDPESRIMPLRKFRSYVDQARIPMPERLESWNYMYREDLASMLHPEFRAAIDARGPYHRMAEFYAEAPSDHLLHRMLFFDWQCTLSDNDLRKVGTMCELAGVRVSYPMLDSRVIDLSLEVPPSMQLDGIELRSFFKQAMRGFLPDEILTKPKHGFGLPFGVWLKSHTRLREMIFSYLDALKARRLVRPEYLDRLVVLHRDGHPGYYGYAIWDLAMLEAWLQAHADVKFAPGGAV